MSFAFHIQSELGTRRLILQLCEKYNPGRTVLRNECKRKNGLNVYTVDVFEPTPYGMYLHDWLRRGKMYDRERRTNPDFPDCLCGPVWCLDGHDSWMLTITKPLPRHA